MKVNDFRELEVYKKVFELQPGAFFIYTLFQVLPLPQGFLSFLNPFHLVILVKVILGVALFQALYGLLQAMVPTLGVLWAGYHCLSGWCPRHFYQPESFLIPLLIFLSTDYGTNGEVIK